MSENTGTTNAPLIAASVTAYASPGFDQNDWWKRSENTDLEKIVEEIYKKHAHINELQQLRRELKESKEEMVKLRERIAVLESKLCNGA